MNKDMENEILSKKTILKIAIEAVHARIQEHLSSNYNSPLNSMLTEVVNEHREEIKKIFNDALSSAITHDDFRQAAKQAFNHKLAKVMVSKLEGGDAYEETRNQDLHKRGIRDSHRRRCTLLRDTFLNA
jgi:hypothetical protein